MPCPLRNALPARRAFPPVLPQQVQAGILNILSSIGISHSLISAVRRRATGDRVVLWVGVTLILVLMFLVYRWTHGGIMGRPSLPQE